MESLKPLLIAEKLSKRYGTLQILQDISLEVIAGEVIMLMGASGAGKSALLYLLATLDRPDSGKLSIAGVDLLTLRDRDLARFRNRHIGFVFQFHNLLPEFTSFENVCLPGYIGNFEQKSKVEARALELLTLLGLERRLYHRPNELSGGEQQRVAVARALINNPTIIFADEPSGSLDSSNAAALHALFFELRSKLGQTFVLATHNQALAEGADRTWWIHDGRLSAEAP
jgi:lipoprotein-releasing system ATP-binding protein